jgi:hypothetical protein
MKKIIASIALCAALPCLLATGCTGYATKQRLGTQDIYRPITLPKNTWQTHASVGGGINYVNDSSRVIDYLNWQSLLLTGFLPNYGITENLTWDLVPFPTFTYLITRNGVNETNGPSVKGLSLAVAGGIDGFDYSHGRVDMWDGVVRLLGKKPLTDFLWLDGQIKFEHISNSYWDTVSSHGNNLGMGLGTGLQLTNRTSLKYSYWGSHNLNGGAFFHYFTVSLNCNLNSYFSLGASITPSIVFDKKKMDNAGLGGSFFTAVQW